MTTKKRNAKLSQQLVRKQGCRVRPTNGLPDTLAEFEKLLCRLRGSIKGDHSLVELLHQERRRDEEKLESKLQRLLDSRG